MKKWLDNIPPYLKNKYVVTSILFLAWMAFFDQNDLITQFKLAGELNDLKEENAYYTREIRKVDSDLQELLSNDQQLEKFAREKYLMKRDNEDIFVIVAE
ncbi:MAG: septum formation initiator family protein [Bacteroidota bacterium]